MNSVFTNEFKLTHEFLGLMLGVTRPSVTVVAKQLQHKGLITYRRGNVTVLDRRRLETGSCECYAIVSKYRNEFLPPLTRSSALDIPVDQQSR